MSSDGKQLLAAGAEVTLADGVSRHLILDMEALIIIEERVGSIGAYSAGLQLGLRGKVLRSVEAGLIGGLSHMEGREALSPRQIHKLMRFEDLQKYIDALDAAWDDAMPAPAGPDGPPGKDSGATSTSPGASSTDGSPSTTVAATASSDA